ncbi:MAG: hypothetical protein KC492_40980, partial [Myxococcales bacterium]|nr:hypothetical protein [Myxococcales bacterium]
MTTARQYGYTYQEADISLGHVAARFHTTVKTIWVSTASRDGKFRNVSEAEFLTTVQTGDRIFVPYEGDAWEWRSIAPKATTLKELCSKKPEPARVGGPSLTSELLWFHIVNEAFRGRCLARVSGLDAKRNLDQDPGSVTIQPSDTLFVPYPMRNKAPRVSAAPNGKGKSAVVVSAPEWISDLRAFDQKVNDLAAQISANSAQCDKLQRDGQAVCYRLAALARLVSFQISRANDKQKGRLQALQAALAKLQSASADLLFANPAEKLQVPQDATRKNLGEKLLLVLHDDKLKALVEKVRKNPQERVHGDSVSLIADRLFERGYRAAGWTQLAEKAKRDTDAAFALLTSSGGAAVDSSTPLSTYISL